MGIIFGAIRNNKIDKKDYVELKSEISIAQKMLLEKIIKDNEDVRQFVNSKLYYVLRTGVVPYKEKYQIYYNSLVDKSTCMSMTLFYDLIQYKGDLRKL